MNNSWIGGPTAKFLPQHVPGYTGHVPALKAENLFAKSYAKVTAKAKRLGTIRQNSYSERQRFNSQHSIEYTPYNFTRLLKEPELLENKDYNDYARYLTRELDQRKEQEIRSNAYKNDELLVTHENPRLPFNSKALANSLLQQKIANYKHKTIASQENYNSEPSITTNYGSVTKRLETSPIKPRLVESRVVLNKKFLNMSSGFQKVFTRDKIDKEIKLPIAGYGGHRVGYHSKNLYGKPFRKLSIESKRLQRCMRASSSLHM